MLKKFAVENYRGFKERTEISFDRVGDYGFNQQYIKNGLLNKVIVIGKNASGKTNLGLAIFDIVLTLTNNTVNSYQTDEYSFLNGDSMLKCATFEYEFKQGNNILKYTYKKSKPRTIISERLEVNGELYFYKDEKEHNYGKLKEEYAKNLNLDTVADNQMSVLKFVYMNTVKKKNSPVSFIIDFANKMLYFNSNTFIGLYQNEEPYKFIINNGLEKDFGQLLSKFGNLSPEASEYVKFVWLFHQKFHNTSINFDKVASSGTKLFTFFYYWSKRFNDIIFLYMDEFDAHYHYEMALNVLRYVADRKNFQTVFTTHNTTLLRNDVLRPDCYMLIGPKGIASFPELTDRELREGHDIERMYRHGEFDE